MATPAKRVRRSKGSASSGGDQAKRAASALFSQPDTDGDGYVLPKDGAIQRIQLVDFMNHQTLDLTFGPRLNFLTGSNGSGKSSILQAIVLCLGGQAKDTKRKANLQGFVRHNMTKADVSVADILPRYKLLLQIKVTLFNGGSESYRYDVYGDAIVFHRTISTKGGASGHGLFTANGEKKYEGSESLYIGS